MNAATPRVETGGYFFEDAMIEFHALADTGKPPNALQMVDRGRFAFTGKEV